jgi:ABC-type uncharacterized transport system auxiliary subunit
MWLRLLAAMMMAALCFALAACESDGKFDDLYRMQQNRNAAAERAA